MGIGGLGGFLQFLGLSVLILGLFHNGSHVLHGNEEGDGKPRAGDFLAEVLGPVAIHQVVVLVGGQALNAAVTAVMVGHHQALVADDLTGAAAAKVHDGIFEAGLVDGVNLIRSELAARGLDVLAVELFEQRQQPHTFIGHGGHGNGQCGQEGKYTFHCA